MGISVAMALFDHLHFVVPRERTCFKEINFPNIEKQYMTFYFMADKYVYRSNKYDIASSMLSFKQIPRIGVTKTHLHFVVQLPILCLIEYTLSFVLKTLDFFL